MKKVHFIGIGGSGANAAAGIAAAMGYEVTGCDQKESIYSQNLEKLGVHIDYEHSIDHLKNVDCVCVSPALVEQKDKPEEYVFANDSGLLLMTWQEFMGKELQKAKKVIAITGTKGKTTTTTFVGLLLEFLQLDPTAQIGSDVKKWGQNFRFGKSEWFVCEADEFNNNFHAYQSDIAVITNIEYDHPEFFHSKDEYMHSFVDFVKKMKRDSALVIGIDSLGARKLLSHLDFYHGKIITYGTHRDADVRLEEGNVIHYGDHFARFSPALGMQLEQTQRELALRTSLPGSHNTSNLLATFCVGLLFNVTHEQFLQFVTTVELPGRRFEHKGDYKGAHLIDDYAHNPMSIRAAIAAAKETYPHSRIIAIWQPHMYSRTLALFDQFVPAFDTADYVIVLPIYASREKNSEIAGKVSHDDIGKAIASHIGEEKVVIANSIDSAVHYVDAIIGSSDVVLNMGAGDNSSLIQKLLDKATL